MLFLIKYVPDEYKTRKMCDKALLENGRTLVLLYFILFLIDIKLKKWEIKFLLKILLC